MSVVELKKGQHSRHMDLGSRVLKKESYSF